MHPSHEFMLNELDLPEHYTRRLEWVFENDVPSWIRFNVPRVVSVAACIVDRKLFIGNRHFCPVMHLQMEYAGISDATLNHDINKHQGFLDQYGVWMSRKEAYIVAKEANQLKNHRECDGEVLYSESYL